MTRFLDTYALIEILEANPRYRDEAREGRTSVANLLEFHVRVARKAGEATADAALAAWRARAVPIEDADIVAASRFKRERKGEGFSYVDALGYAMARNRGWEFVTGDRAFKGLDGVRFIEGRA